MTQHITDKIPHFLDRELSDEERSVVGEHLINCAVCRTEHDEQKAGRELAGSLERTDAPPSMWAAVESKLDEARGSGARSRRLRLLKPALAFGIALMAMLVAVPIYIYLTSAGPETVSVQNSGQEPRPSSWRLLETRGNPQVTKLGEDKNLEIGGVLETDAASSARISVAEIGRVDIAPNSKVRIVNTSAEEHRMALDRGVLKAVIVAPPRLFIVDTPSAQAVDLGCAYTLEVDDDGNSKLHVTSGYVALETEGLESFVPAGAFCESKKGGKLGTPFFGDATADLKKALAEFDFSEGGPDTVDTIISESRRKDTLTLWHLLEKVPVQKRSLIITRILRELDLPEGVTVEGLLGLNETMMMSLRSDLEVLWYEQPGWFDEN